MRVLPRSYLGDPVLRAPAKSVSLSFIRSAKFRRLIGEMFHTMRRAEGVGLAAPQVGLSVRLAVIEVRPTKHRPGLAALPKTVIVNPRIVRQSKNTMNDWEGCLSFPGVRGAVPRSEWIEVEYHDETGRRLRNTLRGFPARVFQHEIDHLEGLIYIDRMPDLKTLSLIKPRIR